MKKARLFIAAEISDKMRRKLEDVQDNLRQTDAIVKWVRMKNVHVTVKFIGGLGLEHVPRVEEIMAEAAAEAAPFSMEIKGLATFPPRKTPRVVFADMVKGQKPLERIYRVLNNGLTELGVKREHRDYRPHLTIGRVKSAKGVDSLKAEIERHKEMNFGSEEVSEILLIISDLQPSGPEYSVMARVPLTGDFQSGDFIEDVPSEKADE